MDGIAARFVRLLGSRMFFWGVLVFFCLQALWIALSAAYPMAFDEDFHFGIIKIYAGQLSPFLAGQPEGADSFGAVARDPSYLYHYLMSFPYRFVSIFTDSQTVHVLALRLLNIPLLALGIYLFSKVLRRAGLSPALANLSIALFTLIPIVPFLGAHINYDNLLMVLVPLMCLFVYDIMQGFKKREVRLSPLVWFSVTFLIAGIVKYAFLPIGLAAVLFLAAYGLRQFWGKRSLFTSAVVKSFTVSGRLRKIILGTLLVLALLLFLQRFGVNLALYKTPVPACDVVLSEQQCSSYGPWLRNHLLSQSKADFNTSPVDYTIQWMYWLWHRMFFVVNGPHSLHATRPPLPLPYYVGGAAAIMGLLALAIFCRRVFRGRAYLGFFLGVIVLYCGTLWAEDYSQYLETSWPVAINGRYLLPLILLGAALIGHALSHALRAWPRLKATLALLVMLAFLQGGGAMAFILRSDETWNWQNKAVIRANNGARQVLSPIMLEGRQYY